MGHVVVQNAPLFIKSFGGDDFMKLQLAVYAALDIVEEKARGELCLGLLCPVEDVKVYVCRISLLFRCPAAMALTVAGRMPWVTSM